MADYSLLGSFSTGGASSLNAELITKLKDADKAAILTNIDSQLESITGIDAETGDALEKLGESDTLNIIKAQTLSLMSSLSAFDLDTTGSTAFDSVSASTTGTAAVFDAVDAGGLEEGTTNITIEQLAQKDVYQSVIWTQDEMDANFPIVSSDAGTGNAEDDLDLIKSSKLSVSVGGETFDFNIFKDLSVEAVSDLSSKSLSELAAEINENEKLIASVETVGTDQFRLVIKSADSGEDNSLTISQTNINIGFSNNKYSSEAVSDTTALIDQGQTAGDEISVNGVSFSTVGKSYEALATEINDYNSGTGDSLTPGAGDTFTATIVDGQIEIKTQDLSQQVSITQTGVDLGFYNSNSSHTQNAQNLEANVDGVDYNISSNTLTIQGNLTMTAVEIGNSTIDIQKDTSAIVTGIESIVDNYNDLVTLITDELESADSVMSDSSTLKTILSSIKDTFFASYGANDDLNLFNFGLELNSEGVMSLDKTIFGEALVNNYDDVQNLFLGNTTDEELAASDATRYLGMGTILQDYLDQLDSSTGMIGRYETSITDKQERLTTEREEALASLDTKYDTMSAQFALYTSAITTLESSFSSLSLMIDQSVSTSS